MFKAVGVWSWPAPEDVEEFERYYVTDHVGAAGGVPNVERLTFLKAGESGRDADIYRIAEMYFADEAAFEAAAESEGWATMVADATKMIERFGVELKACSGYEEDAGG
jgi:uncharacterized protein (TIGR02118 family)